MKNSESVLDTIILDSFEQFLVSENDCISEAISHYEPLVFELAMSLCHDDAAMAIEVVDDVFGKLECVRSDHIDAPLATLLHQLTYQSATLRIFDTSNQVMQ